MAQHLCVKTGQIGVLVCNNLEIETSLQQQNENGNKSTSLWWLPCSTDCVPWQIWKNRAEQQLHCTFAVSKTLLWDGGRVFLVKKFCKGATLQLVQTNLAQSKDHLLTLGASTIWAGVATCTWTARWRKGRVRKQMVTAHVLGAWWPNLAEVLSMTSFVQMHLWST